MFPWVPISLSREKQWPFPQRAAIRNALTDVKVLGEHECLLYTYIELLLIRLPGRGNLGAQECSWPSLRTQGLVLPQELRGQRRPLTVWAPPIPHPRLGRAQREESAAERMHLEGGADRPLGRSGSPLRTAVHDLRASPRRGGMIQTAEQYQFLHHTLALYAAQLPEEPNP